jgi:hypothetical protein
MHVWSEWIHRLRGMSVIEADRDQRNETILDSIGDLSIEEWLLLTYCVDRNQRMIALDVVHPAAGALVAKGLLQRSGSINEGAAWSYTVTDFAWDYLRRDPDRLHRLRGIPIDDPELQLNLARLDHYLRKFG